MKPVFCIRCFPTKQGDRTYLALIVKFGEKTCFVSYDEALILKLCDYSLLCMLKPGEEVEI